MLSFNYYMPTRILFGPGKLAEVADTPFFPGTRALVVVGAGGSMKRSGALDRLISHLGRRGMGAAVYSGITPNPLAGQVDAAAALARDDGCDVVVGLGGGSCVDAAKSIALMAVNEGRYWDYVPRGTGGRRHYRNRPLPIVAIPTTAGTGSEADPWSVITRPETREKMGYGTADTFATLAIVDPELTLTLPPDQTAYTGMDAFFHATETCLATVSQPASHLLSLEAVRIIDAFLPGAVRNGADIAARVQVAWAATAAGICQALSANLVHHVLEHAVSAFKPEVPHGLGLVMLSRAFFGLLESRVPERFADLAAVLRADDGTFTSGLTGLIDRCGLSGERLSGWGFTGADVPDLTQNVYDTVGRHFDITPARLTREDVAGVFESSL